MIFSSSIFEIFQFCAPSVAKSGQGNHFKFLSEFSETLPYGRKQTVYELLAQKKSFSRIQKKSAHFPDFMTTLIKCETEKSSFQKQISKYITRFRPRLKKKGERSAQKRPKIYFSKNRKFQFQWKNHFFVSNIFSHVSKNR